MKIILYLLLFLNSVYLILSSTSPNIIELYISNDNGNNNNNCGLNKDNKCKTIEYAINNIFKQNHNNNNQNNNSNNKLKLLLDNGIYNIESLNIDLESISIEKISFKERPILKYIDDEDKVIVREHDEEEDNNNSGSQEDMFNSDYEDYEDEILEEIEVNQKEEDQVVLIKSIDNDSGPMFSLSPNKQQQQQQEISFKGITFKTNNNNNFNYFIESLNYNNKNQLNINIINCKFENQQNQFINIQDNNNNIKLQIKNSIFLGSHMKEIPIYSGSINLKSNKIESGANVSVESCIFKNIRGCPIYLKNNNNEVKSSIANFNFELKNSIFNNNIKSIHGGAISLSGFNSSLIENSVFENNEALQQGGSISISKSNNVLISNCRFNRNRSNSNGGSVFLLVIHENVEIQDSNFVENLAQYGGSNYFGNCSNAVLKSNKFIENKALVFGASIYCSFSNIHLADYGNQFKRNIINVNIGSLSNQNFIPSQYYYGFDCFVENKKGSTCQFTGVNQTFVNEILAQPNCGGTSISFFILDNIEYLILSVSFLFIPIIVLFIKMSNKRSEQLKNFLITDEELKQQQHNNESEEDDVKNKVSEQKKQQQSIKKRK